MTVLIESLLVTQIREAVSSVCDPEYPDVSIADLGLVESIDVVDASAHVGLIPTFSGCPALHMIAADVRDAVVASGAVESCEVTWLAAPVWSTDRVTPAARHVLADEYTVVFLGRNGSITCPVCGAPDVSEQSMAGPTRCRSVAWCSVCRNAVEVMR